MCLTNPIKKSIIKNIYYRFIFFTVVLFLINIIVSPNHWWFYWPMALVAIILVAKYIKVVFIED